MGSEIIVIPPLRNGDIVRIKDKEGIILKEGKLVIPPENYGSAYPFNEGENGVITYYFEDEAIILDGEYSIEVPSIGKGYYVKPLS